MLLSDTIVDFHLFYDGAVDIQIWALLTWSQCKVSETQVTVKACGPLVIPYIWYIVNVWIFHIFTTCISYSLSPAGSISPQRTVLVYFIYHFRWQRCSKLLYWLPGCKTCQCPWHGSEYSSTSGNISLHY